MPTAVRQVHCLVGHIVDVQLAILAAGLVLWIAVVGLGLRKQDEGWYEFVGECYVDGIMNGEVEKGLRGEGAYEEAEFELR